MAKKPIRERVKRTLTLEDFLMTSYGQTRQEAVKDYRHYVKTGEI